MNNVGEKYLPIGTVVMLKEGSKRVMITGFCSMATEDEETVFDYAGCMYPEGFLSSDQTALFNHEQIDRIYHLGLVDDEERQFKITLNALVNQMNGVEQQPDVPVAPVAPVQPVEQPVPPIGPGLPGYVAPVQPVEQPVPPIGPGLPGYVAPVQPVEQPVPPIGPGLPGYVAPVAPVANGIQFDANGTVIAGPQVPQGDEAPAGESAPAAPNYKFDENGILISA